jgi:hypothetical protein
MFEEGFALQDTKAVGSTDAYIPLTAHARDKMTAQI